MYPSTVKEISGIFVHEQAIELVKHGCEIKIISPVPWVPFPINWMNAKWKAYSQIPSRTIIDGIDIYYPRYLAFPRAMFFASSGRRMYRGIKRLVDKIYHEFPFDLIHAHVVLPNGYAAMLVNKRYNKSLVVTIHGQDLQVTFYKNIKCERALARVFKKSDKIITVSTKLKNMARENFGFSEKIIMLNNGVNTKKLVVGKSNLASNYVDYKIILSVSNLIASKGVDLNLKAISRLVKKHSNLKYVVIGDGPEINNLKKLTFQLNLENNVEFLGGSPHDKVMDYMAIANVFSLPSWREGFGIVYLEAMAHGKPVIGCIGEGIEDIIENGTTGLLVKAKDLDSLFEAIDFLLSNPEECKTMGERARELVLKNYTWQKNAEKILEIYHELIEKL